MRTRGMAIRGIRNRMLAHLKAVFIVCILYPASCISFAVPSYAAIFSSRQVEEINCAAVKMQLFYYYFAQERDPKIASYDIKCRGVVSTVKMPGWIEENVQAMWERKVWRDPEEGDLSEAALWQTAVSIVYEFLEITKKTFPPADKGAGILPGLLVKEYADMRVRFQMSLDRIYRAPKMGDSMKSRGRALQAIFDLILKEMESILDAISSGNSGKYAQSASAIAVLSQDALGQLFRPARGLTSEPEPPAPNRFMPVLLKMAGLAAIFIGVLLFFKLNEKKLSDMSRDYAAKTASWTEDFNRQFLAVKVQYLVMIPFAFFVIAGILTFNLPVFLVFTAVGAYLGLNTPAKVLKIMKERRGKKIDT
ncbi:MAG: hypothetical protein ABIG11_00805, partial [bacterium]